MVIRQAISCDICGTEKKQTNHWFVAYDHGGELRLSGWVSRNRLRPGSKHLCGQTCLHKLVDDFMAKALAVRPEKGPEEEEAATVAEGMHGSLISKTPKIETSGSMHVLPEPVPAMLSWQEPRTPPEHVSMPTRLLPAENADAVPEDAPSYESRGWQAEAWERERAREAHTDIASRRRLRS